MAKLSALALLCFTTTSVASAAFVPRHQLEALTQVPYVGNVAFHRPSAIRVKQDEAQDAKREATKEEEATGLDEGAFLETAMDEIAAIDELTKKKDSGALEGEVSQSLAWASGSPAPQTSISTEEEGQSDIYSRAAARMERLAKQSVMKHALDKERMARADSKPSAPQVTSSGPLDAFTFLGVAIGAGLAVAAPDAVTNIDLSSIALPSVDFSSLDLPTIDSEFLGQMNGRVDEVRDALVGAKDSLLSQVGAVQNAVPTIADELQRSVASQVGEAQAYIQSKATSMSNIDMPSFEMPKLDASALDPIVEEAKSAIFAQVGAIESAANGIQDSFLAKSNDLLGTIADARDAVLSRVDVALGALPVALGEVRGAVLGRVGEAQAVARDAMSSNEMPSIASIELPKVDASAVVDRAKGLQDAVVTQASASIQAADGEQLPTTYATNFESYANIIKYYK